MTNTVKALWHHIKNNQLLWAVGAALFGIGVGIVLLSYNQWIESNLTLFSEVLRELGIAIWISVFIAAVIELSLAQKTFEKGLDAIMKQTVPDEVWDEIKQHVICQPVMRSEWTIDMKVKPSGKNEYFSTTTVTYNIKSLRDLVRQEISHEVDAPRVLDLQHLFKWIKVGDIDQQSKKCDLKEVNLAEVVKDNGACFTLIFSEENQCKRVELCFEERVRENEVINWWMNFATRKVTVDVDIPSDWSADLQAHHPEKDILHRVETNKSRWESSHKAVMLPGQGFEIRLSHRNDSSPG